MVTKLTIEYDGTDFAGWARQPDKRTVQEELERALRTVLGETGADGRPLTLTVAGRTDAPVIASGGVSSLDDLRAIATLTGSGVEGAIVGKALYAGRFTLPQALAAVAG